MQSYDATGIDIVFMLDVNVSIIPWTSEVQVVTGVT